MKQIKTGALNISYLIYTIFLCPDVIVSMVMVTRVLRVVAACCVPAAAGLWSQVLSMATKIHCLISLLGRSARLMLISAFEVLNQNRSPNTATFRL